MRLAIPWAVGVTSDDSVSASPGASVFDELPICLPHGANRSVRHRQGVDTFMRMRPETITDANTRSHRLGRLRVSTFYVGNSRARTFKGCMIVGIGI